MSRSWVDELLEREVPGMAEVRRKQQETEARLEARTLECAKFWREKLDMLADKHADALGRIDYFRGDVEWQSKELKRKLQIGYQMLLQQSDARWSRKITDKALENLDHDAVRFRYEAS